VTLRLSILARALNGKRSAARIDRGKFSQATLAALQSKRKYRDLRAQKSSIAGNLVKPRSGRIRLIRITNVGHSLEVWNWKISFQEWSEKIKANLFPGDSPMAFTTPRRRG